MIEKKVIEKLVGKSIIFYWKNNEKQLCSTGILKEVTEKNLIVEFHGKRQVYDLGSIVLVREVD